MERERFPELVEMEREIRGRHRKVVAGLVGSGMVAMALGLGIFAAAGVDPPPMGFGAVGIVLIGAGALVAIRGLVSALTSLDTRP